HDKNTVVRFSYAARKPALKPVSGQIELELPQTDLFAHKLEWELAIPSAYELSAVEGNVEIVPADGTIRFRKDLCRDERPSAALSGTAGRAVADVWGPVMIQQHPLVYYTSPASVTGRKYIQPQQSDVSVNLRYEPKKKGLLWYRTYVVDFTGDYVVENPTQIS